MKTKLLALTVVALLCAPSAGAQPAESLKHMAPWTPVTVKTNASGVTVGVWGRSHKLANVLPSSIVTAGGEILAAPIRLVGKVGGKPIEWTRGGNFVFRADQSHAILTGWQAGDDLIVNTTTRV